jgi:hypothetical protein
VFPGAASIEACGNPRIHQRVKTANRALSSALSEGVWRIQILCLLVSAIIDLTQQLISLWEVGNCESHVIQRVWIQGPESCLAANTRWDAVPMGRFQCSQSLRSSSPPYWEEEAVKSHDLEGLSSGPSDPSGSKYMPGCSSQRWASVLSDLAQQFTFLWRRENAVKIT